MSEETTIYHYVASDLLPLYAQATRWKSYWTTIVRRFVVGHVLEVGAGIGDNTAPLLSPAVTAWTALEPDGAQVTEMQAKREKGELPSVCQPLVGTLETLPEDALFETILYIDVIEHIEDDHAEAARAVQHLAPGGRLIVLVPAHQFLFSPFDTAVGHHRRYNRQTLLALAPPGCRLEFFRMLDCVGFFASLANKLLLRAAQPSARQIRLWDRMMVPVSTWLDPVLGYRFGKTAVAVWTRSA